VIEEAARICSRCKGQDLAKGWSSPEIAAASLYAACREKEVLTTLDDAVAASGVPRGDIGRCYRMMVAELGLSIPLSDPLEYMSKLAWRAGARPDVEADAREIMARAARAGITAGARPMVLAASALYLASLLDGQGLTQSGVATAARVGEAAIRRHYKILKKIIDVQSVEPRGERRFGPVECKVSQR
jgi:transcription initiation factor TFIIB